MGGNVSSEGAQLLALLFIAPIAFGASLIANSVFAIEMIKKEKEEMPSDQYLFMYAINAINIVIGILLICISLYYGIYFVLPKKYKLKFDDYFSRKSKLERKKAVMDGMEKMVEQDAQASAIYYKNALGASAEELAKLEANRWKKK